MLRVRMVGRKGRVCRVPIYEVEKRVGESQEWVRIGDLDGGRVGEMLRPGLSPMESTEVIATAFKAFRDGDSRWVYPLYGLSDEPPYQ